MALKKRHLSQARQTWPLKNRRLLVSGEGSLPHHIWRRALEESA